MTIGQYRFRFAIAWGALTSFRFFKPTGKFELRLLPEPRLSASHRLYYFLGNNTPNYIGFNEEIQESIGYKISISGKPDGWQKDVHKADIPPASRHVHDLFPVAPIPAARLVEKRIDEKVPESREEVVGG